MSVRNSNSSKRSSIFSSSIFLLSNSSFSNSIGTSIFIVAKNLEKRICSLLFSSLSFSVPFMLAVFSRIFSIVPNSAINFSAVFAPTPGHPGILSEESPIKPSKSIMSRGEAMLYFSMTALSSNTSKPFPANFGLYMKIRSLVN